MNDRALFRTLGAAAILGGALRVVSAFVPWAEEPWIEALYLAIDIFLLFGLMGVYFAYRERIGVLGFIAFAVAETGIASIVGPDGMTAGFPNYFIGVLTISAGLFLLSIQLLLKRAGSPLAPACWIVSTVAGAAGKAAGQDDLGFLIGGILFGLAFILAGFDLIRPRDRVEQAA